MSQNSRSSRLPPLAQPYLPAQELPKQNPFAPNLDLWRSAYDACLNYEGRVAAIPKPKSKLPLLVCARVLGYMLYFSPTYDGRDNISKEILSCENNDSLLADLAGCYVRGFIPWFRVASGPMPKMSSHSSRKSPHDYRETLKEILEENPRSHATAKKLALVRDNYRCVLTRAYDSTSIGKFPWLQAMSNNEPDVDEVPTHCAHIIPETINQHIIHENGVEIDDTASVWAVLNLFGQVDIGKELNGANIHRLENVITMGVELHIHFDQLLIWLEETDVPNQYYLRAVRPKLLARCPEIITFSSSDDRLSLPDPRYLRLHAVCSQVTHFSGAAEYIQSIFRDLDEMRVLSEDGSSAEAFFYALIGRTGVVV